MTGDACVCDGDGKGVCVLNVGEMCKDNFVGDRQGVCVLGMREMCKDNYGGRCVCV